ncbi:CinA family protein [Qipengyuania sp.]|uniref:CinA family protein n=1 Tax=Qipengyuania sp. TaxID=2004515 RepID=UPI0035C858F2
MTENHNPNLASSAGRLAREVLEIACDREIPLATAESCTGGLLASLLTDVEGYSHIFDRGFVVYSTQAKCDLLGIERRLVDDCGAVSRNVAEAMALGALDRSEAGLALSITGFAGPTKDGEEGLVHLACATGPGDIAHREEHFGKIGRDSVRSATLEVALEMMKEVLAE